MNPRLALLIPVAVAAALLRPLAGQDLAASRPFDLAAPPMAAANIDEPHGDGVFWVRGATYKARVDQKGVTFLPLFPGAAAHTPLQLGYRGASATRALRRGQTLELRHSDQLVEQWRAELQGMEQSFVLAAPPATPDLVLQVDVDTALEYVGYDGGLVFAAAGLGKVTYGEGVVFDAAGRRAPVIPRFEHGVIALRVSAAFLAGAVYPVTVDPLLGNFTASQAGLNAVHPDIARDPGGNGDFIVIFEEVVNASDRDIVGHRYRPDGTFVSRLFFESGADSCVDPKICATLGATSLLAVWDNNGASPGIQARTYRLTQALFEPVAQVTADGFGVDTRHPDVGGGTQLGVNNIGQMCVFVRVAAGVNLSLRGIRLQSNGIPAAGDFVIDGQPGCDPRPDIAPSGGNPLHWPVVWQERSGIGCNGGDIHWAVVNLGGVVRPAEALEAGPEDELQPRAFTHGTDSLIAWHQFMGSDGDDVAVVLMRRSGVGTFSRVGAKFNLSRIEPGCPVGQSQNQVALGFDGCRHSYAYMENQRPKAACVTAGSYAYSEGHASLSATQNNCGATAMTHVPLDNSPVRHAVVWQENLGSRFEIRGAFYEGRQNGPTVATLTTRCGSHGLTGIQVERMPAIGHTFDVTLSTVVGLPLLLIGPPATPVPLCSTPLGTCQQGITSILTSVFTPRLGVALPCEVSLVGVSLAFQGVDVGAPGGCGAGLFGVPFRVTDTVVVTVR